MSEMKNIERENIVAVIEGNIGAGKSTLLQSLRRDYKCFEEPVSEWNLLEDFYKAPEVFAFPFQMQVLISQYNQQKQIYKLPQNNDVIFIERSPWVSRNIFIKNMELDGIWNENHSKSYDEFYNTFDTKIRIMFYLDITPEQCFERIKKRNRLAEDNIPIDYLRGLDNLYKDMIRRAEFPIVILDATKSTQDLVNDITFYLSNFNLTI